MGINQYDVPAGGDMNTSVTAVVNGANAQYTAGKVEVLVDNTYSKLAVIRGLLAVIQKITTASWPA